MTEQASRPKARDLNQVIRYTMWSVFRVRTHGEVAEGHAAEGTAGVVDLLLR